MRKEKFNLKTSILTETLPYELPYLFSNFDLYKFLIDNKTQFDAIILKNNLLKTTIPFNFNIKKKDSTDRTLSLVNPYAQILIAKFIETNKNLILNYFNQKHIYSVRYPLKINNTYKKIPLFLKRDIKNLLVIEDDILDELESEFVNNTFILYKYKKITDFYKSLTLKKLEVKFSYMTKLDYSNCFSSIYTHSIDWAYLGDRHLAKSYIGSKERFSALLDKIMQTMNYNETNGIVVGPEFSRLVAEIVLVRLDNLIFDKIKMRNFIYKKDYDIVRYIDDIFLFYNNKEIGSTIEKLVTNESSNYKMSINKNKSYIEKRPFMRKSNWKVSVKKSLQNYFKNMSIIDINSDNEKEALKKRNWYHENFFESIKSVLIDFEDSIQSIISYVLSTLERKCNLIFNRLDECDFDVFNYHLIKIIDTIFYLLTYSINYENVNKICRILYSIKLKIDLRKDNQGANREELDYGIEDFIFKKIMHIIEIDFNNYSTEMLNFIVLLAFNNKNSIPDALIVELLRKNNSSNYLTMSVFIYYVIKKGKYNYLKTIKFINKRTYEILKVVKDRYKNNKTNSIDQKSAESILLSEHFYVIHDFYSSGILNQKNINEIEIIKNKLSVSNSNKLLNLYFTFIKDFNVPFMKWDADDTVIISKFIIQKIKSTIEY